MVIIETSVLILIVFEIIKFVKDLRKSSCVIEKDSNPGL